MPSFIAVRCFQCGVLQNIQRNKRQKFECKLCGAKQSVRRVYCESDHAKDIR